MLHENPLHHQWIQKSMHETLKAAWVDLLSCLFPSNSINPDNQIDLSDLMDSGN